MTSVDFSNPAMSMLNNAFTKFDRNKDGKLSADEFKGFNEVLKPGVAVDAQGKPTIDFSKTMDKDKDGSISRDEMNQTNMLVPAQISDPSLKSTLEFLLSRHTTDATAAALILQGEDLGASKQAN